MVRLVFEGSISKSGDGFVIWIPKDLKEKAKTLLGKRVVVMVEEIAVPRKRKG